MSRTDEPRRFLWNGLWKVLSRFTERFESCLRLAAGSCHLRRMGKIYTLEWKVRTQLLLRFECRVADGCNPRYIHAIEQFDQTHTSKI